MDATTDRPKPRRRFVGRSGAAPSSASSSKNRTGLSASVGSVTLNQIPDDILQNSTLNACIKSALPDSYNFEIHKTIWQIRKFGVKRVALQMPEGLTMFACSLVDLVENFTSAEAIIMGDVTYGACCVDDFTAKALGCDMLVHYGHSCLIPVDQTSIRTLYVFVEISIDRQHLADTVRLNFPDCIPNLQSEQGKPSVLIGPEETLQQNGASTDIDEVVTTTHIAVVGTVQFIAAVQGLKSDLENEDESESAARLSRLAIENVPQDIENVPTPPLNKIRRRKKFKVTVPQIKPLSPGEILGCTAPKLDSSTNALLYVGDGRFHLESIMIANPDVPAFRYDPYDKSVTREGYDHSLMRKLRGDAVREAKMSLSKEQGQGEEGSKGWAIVLGTLGRQGSLAVMNSVARGLQQVAPDLDAPAHILLSELSPAKMKMFEDSADVFVQTSCPRLSIDWGYAFPRPLLSPYEAKVALGQARGWQGMNLDHSTTTTLEHYPVSDSFISTHRRTHGTHRRKQMDFYADESLGDWTPRHGKGVRRVGSEAGRPMPRRKV